MNYLEEPTNLNALESNPNPIYEGFTVKIKPSKKSKKETALYA
jgi:hypothetical protein